MHRAHSIVFAFFFFLVPFFYKVSVLDCCTGLIYWSVSAMRAAVTAWRKGSGLWRALALASWRMNPAASSLQRPPASTPKTTKRQRPGWTSSGHVRSLDLRTIFPCKSDASKNKSCTDNDRPPPHCYRTFAYLVLGRIDGLLEHARLEAQHGFTTEDRGAFAEC